MATPSYLTASNQPEQLPCHPAPLSIGLALKADQRLRISADARRQNLDRHLEAQLRVRGALHLSHAACAELGGEPVVGEGRADHFRDRTFPSGYRMNAPCLMANLAML